MTGTKSICPINGGTGFITKPFATINKALESLVRLGPDIPNVHDTFYELFALKSIWYNVYHNRWPHVTLFADKGKLTAGCLIRDWTKEFVEMGIWFDMGSIQCFAGLRVPVSTRKNLDKDTTERVFLELKTEDDQCLEDFVNQESIEYLKLLFSKMEDQSFMLDTQSDPFLLFKVPHTYGVQVYERLLDHLETIYKENCPNNLCGKEQ